MKLLRAFIQNVSLRTGNRRRSINWLCWLRGISNPRNGYADDFCLGKRSNRIGRHRGPSRADIITGSEDGSNKKKIQKFLFHLILITGHVGREIQAGFSGIDGEFEDAGGGQGIDEGTKLVLQGSIEAGENGNRFRVVQQF